MKQVRNTILLLILSPVAHNGLTTERLATRTTADSPCAVAASTANRIRPSTLPQTSLLRITAPTSTLRLRTGVHHTFSRRSVVLNDSRIHDERKQRSNQRRGGDKDKKRRSRWRIFSKFLQRSDGAKSHHESHEPLHMTTFDIATEDMLDAIANDYVDDDFMLRNFDTYSPSMVLPEVNQQQQSSSLSNTGSSAIDSEFFDVGINCSPATNEQNVESASSKTSGTAAASDTKSTSSNSTGRSISLSRFVSGTLENILIGIINRRSVEPPKDLQVQALTRGGALHPLLRGKVNADAKINVGKLVLPNIRMSGGTLEVKRMILNVFGFCPDGLRLPPSRFPKQFDLHFQNMIFTQEDLLGSCCITNGLRRLLVRILRDRGVQASTVQVTSVNILVRVVCVLTCSENALLTSLRLGLTIAFLFTFLFLCLQPNGKISCQGKAKTFIGTSHDFEVRTGLGTSSRGHVLTFPGLEICLNRDLGFFVPVMPELDLDVGHNAIFRRIEIDGQQKQIRLDASVTITPTRTIRLNKYEQSAAAFSAKFHRDIGQWFTEVLDFTV